MSKHFVYTAKGEEKSKQHFPNNPENWRLEGQPASFGHELITELNSVTRHWFNNGYIKEVLL